MWEASVAGAAPAVAASHVAVKIELNGQGTGPNSVSGTFTSTVGRIADLGTYAETFGIMGSSIDGSRIDAVKVLTGTQGLIVLSSHAFLVLTTPTTATLRGGRWRILFGTGAYAGLEGGGRPAYAPGGIADLATGTVSLSHRGKAQFRRPGADDDDR